MTSTLKGGGGQGKAKMRCYWMQRGGVCMGGGGGGVSECSGRVIFFLSKENCICAISRHHAESNINMLLTKNPLIDSGVTQ